MQIKCLGGVGEYARTCLLLEGQQHTILLDCGVDKSGLTVEEQYPLLTEDIASSIDLVLLSHSHQDHSSALPYLYALGYKGKVVCSDYTAQQVPNYLSSWQKKTTHLLPYEEVIQFQTFTQPRGKLIFEEYHLTVEWGSSGHILGSVWYDLEFEGQQIFFSGDYHTESSLYSFIPPKRKARDLAILNTAYGVDEVSQEERVETFKSALTRMDTILLPLPKFGRSQEVLLLLKDAEMLILEQAILEPLLNMNSEAEWVKPFQFDAQTENIQIVHDAETRTEALNQPGPKIILTPDGMMESEQAQYYFEKLKGDAFLNIIFTGHVAKNTFGDKLLHATSSEFAAKELKIKVHPNIHETRTMLNRLQAKQVLLTHNFKEHNDQVVQHLSDRPEQIHSLTTGDKLTF